jgi:hypothetical protein
VPIAVSSDLVERKRLKFVYADRSASPKRCPSHGTKKCRRNNVMQFTVEATQND